MNLPKVGSIWEHHTGYVYSVVGFANVETKDSKKFPVMILYSPLGSDTVWCRELSDWQMKELSEFIRKPERQISFTADQLLNALSGIAKYDVLKSYVEDIFLEEVPTDKEGT